MGDIHSCAYDLLLFDRALIGGKLIGEDSLAEMFNMDKGYNTYCKTKEYGNIYLIQLHPTTAGDEYSIECIQIIITAAL